MNRLTSAQRQVLDLLTRYVESHGYPPTRKELATEIGCWPNAVQDHLSALHTKGYVRIDPHVARGIVLL